MEVIDVKSGISNFFLNNPEKAEQIREHILNQINKYGPEYSQKSIRAYYNFVRHFNKPFDFEEIVRRDGINTTNLISELKQLSKSEFKKIIKGKFIEFENNKNKQEMTSVYDDPRFIEITDDAKDIAENIEIPKKYSAIYIVEKTLIPIAIGATAFGIVIIGIILIANGKNEKYYYIDNNN